MTGISKFEQAPKRAARAPGTDTGQHRRQGAAVAGVGAAGMAGAAARNPVSHAVQHAQERRGASQMASGRAAMAAEHAKPRPAHAHLRGYQADGSFVSATRARSMANVERNARIGQAAREVSEGKRVVRAARRTGGKTGKGLLIGGLVGAPLAYAGSRRAVKKSATKHDVDAAAGGAAVGAVAYHGGPLLNEGRERKNEAQIRSSPRLKAKLERHQAAHGVSPRSRPGDPHYLGFFRNYPKDLPGATVKRTLAHTHGGKTGLATQAAVVGGAAAGAVGLKRKLTKKPQPVVKSAFGVEEHVSKVVGEEYVALQEQRLARRRAKVADRPRAAYTAPTAEQKAAQDARRADQAAAKGAKQFARVPGTASPWMSHVKTGPAVRTGVALAAAGGAAYVLHRRNRDAATPVAKADQKTDAAAGAVVGAGVADAGLTVGGQAGKAALKRQRERLGTSPHDEKVWAEHKAKFGVTGRSDVSLPNGVKNAMHASYPKELPGWQGQRALALKNKPGVVGGVLAAGALTGAAVAHHQAKEHAMKRSAFGVNHNGSV